MSGNVVRVEGGCGQYRWVDDAIRRFQIEEAGCWSSRTRIMQLQSSSIMMRYWKKGRALGEDVSKLADCMERLISEGSDHRHSSGSEARAQVRGSEMSLQLIDRYWLAASHTIQPLVILARHKSWSMIERVCRLLKVETLFNSAT